MIKKLSIRNYTLIDELNIEFNSGLPVKRVPASQLSSVLCLCCWGSVLI